MAALFCRLLPVLTFLLLRQSAEAISEDSRGDLNRVLITYNGEYDNCRGVTDQTGVTSRAAADKACEQAFEALDSFGINTCYGWRHAQCRLVSKTDKYYQCSCAVSECDRFSVKNHQVKSFRDCAPALWTRELQIGAPPPPSTNFQQCWSNLDNAYQLGLLKRTYSGRYAGSSSNPYGTKAAISTGIHNTQEGASSYLPYTPAPHSLPLNSMYPMNQAKATTPAGVLCCPVCGNTYKKLHYLENHMKNHVTDATSQGALLMPGAESGRFRCGECGKSYINKKGLRAHEKSHTSLDLYCNFCKKMFGNKTSFMTHMRKKHQEFLAMQSASESILGDSTFGEASLRYPCAICRKRFSKPQELKEHRKKSHTKDDKKCHICGQTFPTKTAFKAHMNDSHPGTLLPLPVVRKGAPAIQDTESGRYVCSNCNKSYVHKRALRAHEKYHTHDTYCGFCKYPLGTVNAYYGHMRMMHPEYAAAHLVFPEAAGEQHEIEKNEICELCGKGFKNKRGLKEHMPFHEGKTKCDVCGQVYSRLSSLSEHKRFYHPKKSKLD